MSHLMTKLTKWHVRPVKTQISLGIRPVWSESSLSTLCIAKDLTFRHADSNDCDQTGRLESLLGAHVCWFCHVVAQLSASLVTADSPGMFLLFLGRVFGSDCLLLTLWLARRLQLQWSHPVTGLHPWASTSSGWGHWLGGATDTGGVSSFTILKIIKVYEIFTGREQIGWK